MNVLYWSIFIIFLIISLSMYTRTQEGLDYKSDKSCKQLVFKIIYPIIPKDFKQKDKNEVLEKLYKLKDEFDSKAISGNKLAIKCNTIIIDLISFLKRNDIKGFLDRTKNLLA